MSHIDHGKAYPKKWKIPVPFTQFLGPTPFILLTFLLKEAKFEKYSVKLANYRQENSQYLKKRKEKN